MNTITRWMAVLTVSALMGCGGSGENTSTGTSSGGSGQGGSSAGGSDQGGSDQGGGGEGGSAQGGGAQGGGAQGGGGEGGSTGCTTNADCDDGISCTTDTCDAGTCSNTVDNTACDDGMYCNGTEVCDPDNGDATTGCVAGTDPCDDGISCTTDSCDESADSCGNTPDNTVCDDASYCNGAEICDPANGDPTTGCLAGSDPCNDGISCTTDTCDETNDSCGNTPDNTVCDDTNYCNGAEICDPLNGDPTTGCLAGSDPCNDGVVCTQDTCDETNDSCTNAPNNAACDDTNFCNGTETCDPQNGDPTTGCLAGTTPCDDGFGCTQDTCDETNDTCGVVPNNAACSDGQFCNGEEVCDPGNGDPTTGCRLATLTACEDGVDCTIDSCDEVNDTCTNAPDDTECDDGLTCTGTETCTSLGCSSTPVDCSDGVGCTNDFCDTQADACVNVPQNSQCSDGQFCNGAEVCDPVSDCQPGTPPTCDDNVGCTDDSCDEVNDTCAYVPVDSACSDGQFCNGAEVCDPVNDCQAGTAPNCDDTLDCTADSCDEANDTCVNAPNDNFCDDTLFCNGSETCDPNAMGPGTGCVAGTNFNCTDDGIACTVETCDEATLGCISTPDDSLCTNPSFPNCVPALMGCVAETPCTTNAECDDGNACNGVEFCDGTVCQDGTPVDCNDQISCTIDSCNPSDGTCNNVPSDQVCDDGFVCNGVETCDTQLGCLAGTPIDCNDGVSCTVDTCTEPNGVCLNTASNQACNDGVFCNGTETCDPVNDCQPGTAPTCNDNVACTDDICDATLDACVNDPNNGNCACGETCDEQLGCGDYCVISECQGKVYQCGDCIDNDGDCDVDVGVDESCLGPCDNNETGYKGEIPGQNQANCKMDCYFDGDTGAGNDDCYWTHDCDPNQVPPNYDPEGPVCNYDPTSSPPGTNLTCSELDDGPPGQSQLCLDYCGPLTPNGCDCFGCCEVPGAPNPVWLGSEDLNGDGSCNETTLNDPTACRVCEIVDSCFNPCENCELCLGKTELPPECLCQQCPEGAQLCGDPCGTPCPFGFFCNNGCCTANPG